MWRIRVCESRTPPSRLLRLAGVIGDRPHKLTTFSAPSGEERRGEMVTYQIWDFKSKSEAKHQERLLCGSKVDPACLCVFTSVLPSPIKLKNLQMESAWERDSSACRTVSAFSHLWAVTLVSPGYCYEFSIVISRLHSCHKAGWMARMAIDVTLCCLQGV